MTRTLFRSIQIYFSDVFFGIRSLLVSCKTAVPYVFSWGDLTKEETEQYPDPVSSRTAADLPPKSRGFIKNNIDLCTGCRDCEEVCPSQCIELRTEPTDELNKLWVSVYNVDHAKCMFCGLCVEACLPQALSHTREFEGSAYQRESLVFRFGRGMLTQEQRDKWAALRKTLEAQEDLP